MNEREIVYGDQSLLYQCLFILCKCFVIIRSLPSSNNLYYQVTLKSSYGPRTVSPTVISESQKMKNNKRKEKRRDGTKGSQYPSDTQTNAHMCNE